MLKPKLHEKLHFLTLLFKGYTFILAGLQNCRFGVPWGGLGGANESIRQPVI